MEQTFDAAVRTAALYGAEVVLERERNPYRGEAIRGDLAVAEAALDDPENMTEDEIRAVIRVAAAGIDHLTALGDTSHLEPFERWTLYQLGRDHLDVESSIRSWTKRARPR